MPSFTVFKGSESGKIVESTTTREVGADEVLIKVSHSGVCGTDLHFLDKDIVLGHEGVGVIVELGTSVTTLAKGDTVGWGYVQSSCLSCAPCLSSSEQLCPTASLFGTSNLDQGSFATHGIWKASFVYKIPDGIEPKHAAPLMCGGATVFHVLRSFGVGAGERVGIVGVGGLGHLAIQFASKMGCEVIVFSGSESKREEATKLGAHTYIAIKNKSSTGILSQIGDKKLNHLIITSSQPPDWDTMLNLMAPKGAIYPLTVNEGTLPMPYRALTSLELRVQGSRVSPRGECREMLNFAGLHGVRPIVEEFPMSREGIEEAIGKLESGKMRYRGVLVV